MHFLAVDNSWTPTVYMFAFFSKDRNVVCDQQPSPSLSSLVIAFFQHSVLDYAFIAIGTMDEWVPWRSNYTPCDHWWPSNKCLRPALHGSIAAKHRGHARNIQFPTRRQWPSFDSFPRHAGGGWEILPCGPVRGEPYVRCCADVDTWGECNSV